eukprot:14554281-Ditylum_brightwellii.AAC.1
MAKLLFLCNQGRPDIMTMVVFLTTCVKEPDKDDWDKLVRVVGYLKGTKEMVLMLSADGLN